MLLLLLLLLLLLVDVDVDVDNLAGFTSSLAYGNPSLLLPLHRRFRLLARYHSPSIATSIFSLPQARENLFQHAGVVIVKDSSANKVCEVLSG